MWVLRNELLEMQAWYWLVGNADPRNALEYWIEGLKRRVQRLPYTSVIPAMGSMDCGMVPKSPGWWCFGHAYLVVDDRSFLSLVKPPLQLFIIDLQPSNISCPSSN